MPKSCKVAPTIVPPIQGGGSFVLDVFPGLQPGLSQSGLSALQPTRARRWVGHQTPTHDLPACPDFQSEKSLYKFGRGGVYGVSE
jgi:hypothetical protein